MRPASRTGTTSHAPVVSGPTGALPFSARQLLSSRCWAFRKFKFILVLAREKHDGEKPAIKTNYLVGPWDKHELGLESLCDCPLPADAENQVLHVNNTAHAEKRGRVCGLCGSSRLPEPKGTNLYASERVGRREPGGKSRTFAIIK